MPFLKQDKDPKYKAPPPPHYCRQPSLQEIKDYLGINTIPIEYEDLTGTFWRCPECHATWIFRWGLGPNDVTFGYQWFSV